MVVQSDYGKIKKVYSIWICTNPSREMEYSITRYKMTEENIEGAVKASKANYDLMDIIMVCLGKKKYDELTGLLGLLNLTLLDNYLDSNEKRKILSTRFDIEITPELEKGVADMCNLSAGIEKKGVQKGIKQGIKQGIEQGIDKGKTEIILEMLKENQPLDLISRVSKYSKEKIAEIGRLNGVL